MQRADNGAMPSARITLPQVLALMAIWTAVIYGVVAKPTARQTTLTPKPTVACAKDVRDS